MTSVAANAGTVRVVGGEIEHAAAGQVARRHAAGQCTAPKTIRNACDDGARLLAAAAVLRRADAPAPCRRHRGPVSKVQRVLV